MTQQDARVNAIKIWLEKGLHLSVHSFATASSDASFRRYFRVVHPQGRYIVMDAPPGKEDIKPFIRVAELFAGSGINVPKIYQQNLEQGFLLLEDFGSQCFLDALNPDNADELYQDALNSLFTLQTRTDISQCRLPHYDHALLRRELGIFEEWFIDQYSGIDLNEADRGMLDKTWSALISSALEQPVVCVHRDYHSRNLMLLTASNPGIIDFQDAVIGPVSYDLVSLLRDCYIAWPESKVEHWLRDYYRRLLADKIIDCQLTTFRRWFDLMGMQRHLKAIGIFSRLKLRDGKADYLHDIPRTMNYVKNVAARYPELADFNRFLQQLTLPSGQSAQ